MVANWVRLALKSVGSFQGLIIGWPVFMWAGFTIGPQHTVLCAKRACPNYFCKK